MRTALRTRPGGSRRGRPRGRSAEHAARRAAAVAGPRRRDAAAAVPLASNLHPSERARRGRRRASLRERTSHRSFRCARFGMARWHASRDRPTRMRYPGFGAPRATRSRAQLYAVPQWHPPRTPTRAGRTTAGSRASVRRARPSGRAPRPIATASLVLGVVGAAVVWVQPAIGAVLLAAAFWCFALAGVLWLDARPRAAVVRMSSWRGPRGRVRHAG